MISADIATVCNGIHSIPLTLSQRREDLEVILVNQNIMNRQFNATAYTEHGQNIMTNNKILKDTK